MRYRWMMLFLVFPLGWSVLHLATTSVTLDAQSQTCPATVFHGNTGRSHTVDQLVTHPNASYYHVFGIPAIPPGMVFRPMVISLSTNYGTVNNGIPMPFIPGEGASDGPGSRLPYSPFPYWNGQQAVMPGILPEWEAAIELVADTPGGPTLYAIARTRFSTTPNAHVPPADAAKLIIYPGNKLTGRMSQTTPNWGSDGPWLVLYWRGWLFPDTPECIQRLLGMQG